MQISFCDIYSYKRLVSFERGSEMMNQNLDKLNIFRHQDMSVQSVAVVSRLVIQFLHTFSTKNLKKFLSVP